MANKIKYGLKNVYYAKATIADDGSATYTAPVRIPGAVNLTLDAEGDTSPFYADDIVYYIGQSNNGYSGSLEAALIPDAFRTDILGEVKDKTSGLQYERTDVEPSHFALLFQFAGDESATRHVMYNCTASRPAVASQTKETSVNPVTETLDLTATSVYVAALDADIVKAKAGSGDAAYANFFTAVVQPGAAG